MRRARRNKRPRHFTLGDQRKVEEQLFTVVARQDLEPDRQPVHQSPGDADSGAAVEIEGVVSTALFMMARAKPTSWMRSRPGSVEGGGPRP